MEFSFKKKKAFKESKSYKDLNLGDKKLDDSPKSERGQIAGNKKRGSLFQRFFKGKTFLRRKKLNIKRSYSNQEMEKDDTDSDTGLEDSQVEELPELNLDESVCIESGSPSRILDSDSEKGGIYEELEESVISPQRSSPNSP